MPIPIFSFWLKPTCLSAEFVVEVGAFEAVQLEFDAELVGAKLVGVQLVENV